MELSRLIEKYKSSGPRYTSYPTALSFSENADAALLAASCVNQDSDFSLYVHIPFCQSLCRFCACSTTICKDVKLVDEYLDLLDKELLLWKKSGLKNRKLKQIHFGGGTPNFLSPKQIGLLNKTIERYFEKDSDCEFSVELDPRTLNLEKVEAFAASGVNRVSLGVQDTNEQTQKAIGRIQPHELNLKSVQWLKTCGIDKINVDLIYGLPLQTAETFSQTVSDALEISPDRIALFQYAHVPWVKYSQKSLEKLALPTSAQKVEMFISAMRTFESAGFEYIGLDHFALPQDTLIEARKNKTLQRNFQGYSTHGGLNSLGIGLTSISQTASTYRQNHKEMALYKKCLLEEKLPIAKGIVLNAEDILRRRIIMDIMCNLNITFSDYCPDFAEKFSKGFDILEKMSKDGIINLTPKSLSVTKLGRIFLRSVAMVFDEYFSADDKGKYSKTL